MDPSVAPVKAGLKQFERSEKRIKGPAQEPRALIDGL
jgi:hypothetical protein